MTAHPAPAQAIDARDGRVDGIRGIAILLVILWHNYIPIPELSPYLRLAWSGVDLFFVVSGYLIGGILIRNRDQPKYFATFYGRRFARILPLYVLLLAAYALLAPLAAGSTERLVARSFSAEPPAWMLWTFTQNFWNAFSGEWGPHFVGVTWSLAVEEQFYLFLPLAIWLTPRRFVPILCLICIAAAPIFRAWEFEAISRLAPHMLFPGRLDSLMLGVLLAWLLKEDRARALIERFWPLLGVVTLVACAAGVWTLTQQGRAVGSPFLSTYGYTIIALCYFGVVATVLTAKGRVFDFAVANLPMRWCGILCYPLYLVHMPFLLGWDVLLRRPVRELVTALPIDPSTTGLVMIALRFAGLIAVALALHFAIERPFMQLGKRLRYSGRPATPSATAPEAAAP